MWKLISWILLGVLGLIALLLIYGSWRWQSATTDMLARLESARQPIAVKKYSPDELIGLPAPVQRYFRTVLRDGQAIVSGVWVEHSGTFNMSEDGERWRPFRSSQRVIIRRPGFDWDARIAMMPGLSVRVHDAYIAGQGILHASLFGLLSMVNLHDETEVARGELMRFFAEASWYPTALLPSQGVCWQGLDENSARATLRDGPIELTLCFRFDGNGLIESVQADARGRTVAGKVEATPWQGRWSRYELCDGMRVPLSGEVAWMLPDGPKPYWRGDIEKIRYEFVK